MTGFKERDDAIANAVPAGMAIGGDWCQAASGARSSVLDPATGEEIAHVPAAGDTDVDAAVSAARSAFDDGRWTRLSATTRQNSLLRIADLIDREAETIAVVETADNGMPLTIARRLVANAAETFRYFAGWTTKLHGTTADISTPEQEFLGYTRREPIGVAGLIVPWNGPFSFASSKLAVSLAAGCTTVLKPAEETPLGALILARLAQEAGIPDGVVNVLTGGRDAGGRLAAHPDVDKLAFTGSTETGRKIVAAASGNFKKLTLELGGKSPVVILDDADLDRAIPGAAMGIFRNSGQVCMAGSRVYVHRSVHDRVVEGIATIARGLRIGRGHEEGIDIGPLISVRQRDRVMGYIEGGRAAGAEIVAGGGTWGEAGFFVQPTVIAGAHPCSALVTEEIFGPVVAVLPFDDLDEVAAMANDSDFGLAAAIWTRHNGKAHRLAKRLRAGTVWINCQSVINHALPFGGYRQSGWGRENGWQGIEQYLETKTVISAL